MTKALSQNKTPLLSRLIGGGGTRTATLEAEKAQLEAFLAMCPCDYCGFSSDGEAMVSPGFCELLGLKTVTALTDIQNRLSPSDAAALEGVMDRLQENGAAFSIIVQTLEPPRAIKLAGTQSTDTANETKYMVLWAEDVTEDLKSQTAHAEKAEAKESELTQIQTAMNSIPRPIWLRDEEHQIVWCNTSYTEFMNASLAEVIADQKELGVNPKAKKPAGEKNAPGQALAAKALKEGKALDVKAHAIYKGDRLLMKISEIPLGPLNMTLGIGYNVTREEELETELKRYQSSNKELLEQLRSAIAIYSTDENLEFYNSAFAQLWDLEEKYLNTKPKLGDIMEKLRETRRLPEQADFKRFKQSWQDMITRLIDPHEDMLHLPDGSALRLLAVPHSMGGIMMTFEDVTSRLELESSYNTLIAVQKETLDNLAEAVAVYGGDGRLKLSNPAFGRLWGLNPEDLEGEPHITRIVEKLKKFFTEKEWPQRQEELIAKGLDRIMHEGRLAYKSGTLIDFTTVPLPDGGVLITYTDVTDSVRVENALREKNAALEAAEQLKLDFLANVSYQLRTPLNAIMGFNEILDQEYFGPLNKRQKEYTRDMHEASTRLLDLINDILDLSTLEAGYMKLEREEVKIHDMLQGVYDLVGEWARKQSIEVALHCPKNVGTILADGRRLQQAVINLVRNSITFTPSGGKIKLSASRKKDAIHITVTDTGIGISDEDRQRIFEPFERAQSGSNKARLSRSGAGLGLSLVQNIIALHGGEVDLDSAPGEGTTVTLVLPFNGEKTDLKLDGKD